MEEKIKQKVREEKNINLRDLLLNEDIMLRTEAQLIFYAVEFCQNIAAIHKGCTVCWPDDTSQHVPKIKWFSWFKQNVGQHCDQKLLLLITSWNLKIQLPRLNLY